MEKQTILETVKKVREISPKRKFNQSFDLIINLTNIDLKKQEQKVDLYYTLPHGKGKNPKICALIDNELSSQAKGVFDKIILKEEFSSYTNKKPILRRLSEDYDFFIAQANLMGQIASTFGKVLGPRGKMPSPKAGCVIPPSANLQAVKEKLQKAIHLETKNEPVLKASIGNELMKDEELVDNIHFIYNQLIHSLPQEKNNIKSFILKLSMGPAVKITDKGPVVKEKPLKEKKVKQKKEKELVQEKKVKAKK